jgi:peptide/nickel transport system substrate-binding protein
MYSGKKIVTVAVLAACAALAFAGGKKEALPAAPLRLPRRRLPPPRRPCPANETLYVGGLLWGAPQNFQPPSPTAGTFPVTYNNAVFFVYVPLFMYNQLSNQSEPLLGKSFEWTDATPQGPLSRRAPSSTRLAPDLRGRRLHYMLAKTNPTPWSSYMSYIDEVVAQGPETVPLMQDEQNRQNRSTSWTAPITCGSSPKAHWTGFLAKNTTTSPMALNEFNANPIGSGRIRSSSTDETRVVAQRNDDIGARASSASSPLPSTSPTSSTSPTTAASTRSARARST